MHKGSHPWEEKLNLWQVGLKGASLKSNIQEESLFLKKMLRHLHFQTANDLPSFPTSQDD